MVTFYRHNMKTVNKNEFQEPKDNLKNTRKTLKTLQHIATDKENLTGRAIADKERKWGGSSLKHERKIIKNEDKGVQTEEVFVTGTDLTVEEPSLVYWKKLAEKRQEILDESFQENERLKETIDALLNENRICKDMLEESRHLVEVLQEMLTEEETEVDQEAKEGA